MKTKKNYYPLTIITALTLGGCSGIHRNLSNLFFPPYPNSDQREGEDVKVKITESNECRNTKNSGDIQTNSLFAGIATSEIVGFAVKEVEKFLQEEAKRYTASYSGAAVGECFYKPNQQEISFSGVSIHRKNQRYNIEDTGAMELELDIKSQADQTAFQINPRKIVLRQSKAKIAAVDITRPFGFDILAPWTIFQTIASSPNGLEGVIYRPAKIDLKVELNLHGVWVDKDQRGHAELLASRTINIPRVEIGECRVFSEDGKTTGDNECKSENSDTVNSTPYLREWKKELFPAIPRSWRIDSEKLYTTSNTAYENAVKSDLSQDTINSLDNQKQVLNYIKSQINLSDEIKNKVNPIIADIEKTITELQNNKDAIQQGKLLTAKVNIEIKNYLKQINLYPTGYGNYIVSILVTEVDSFGERVTDIGNTINTNEKTIVDSITKLIE